MQMKHFSMESGRGGRRQEGLKESFLLAQHCDQRPNDLACISISIDVADDELLTVDSIDVVKMNTGENE